MSDHMDTTTYMGRVDDVVKAHGWLVQAVGADASTTPHKPGWAYTIGMGPTLGHPELMLFALPPAVAQVVLNDIGHRIRDGLVLRPGELYSDLIAARNDTALPVCPIVVERRVHPDYFGVGLRYYKAHDLGEPVWWQLVWPDADGALPWDKRFDRSMYRLQPVLGERP